MHHEFENILSGKAQDEEKRNFYLLLAHNPELKQEFIESKKIWDLLHIQMHQANENRKKQLFNEFWKRTHPLSSSKIRNIILSTVKYAAIVVFALFAGFYLNSQLNTPSEIKKIHSEKGSISSIYLADGSKIMLNANTTIQISEGNKQTNVKLEGEAYFEVNHNPKHEFIVDLGNLKVRDIGTKFNISAYPKDSIFRTTLIEGSVDLLDANNKKIQALAENETLRYNKTNANYDIEKIDPLLVTGWTDNKFVFINQPLSEIFKTFEQWYAVQIIVNDPELANETYTSVVRRTTSVKQMLDMFKLTTGIQYSFGESNNVNVIYISK